MADHTSSYHHQSKLLTSVQWSRERTGDFCAVAITGLSRVHSVYWNIQLTSEPVGWPVAGVLGIGRRPGYSGLAGDATVRCRC